MSADYVPYRQDPDLWHNNLKVALRSLFNDPPDPMDDEEILIAATYRFGICGGGHGPGYGYAYKGQSHKPNATGGKFWVDSEWQAQYKVPGLYGKWLAEAIRITFNIPRKGTLL